MTTIYTLKCHGTRKYVTQIAYEDFQAPLCPSCGHPQKIIEADNQKKKD